jgi:hypothetical protein
MKNIMRLTVEEIKNVIHFLSMKRYECIHKGMEIIQDQKLYGEQKNTIVALNENKKDVESFDRVINYLIAITEEKN